ncbi:flagellar hook-associated protein FlgL [compost metagenome]
MQACLSEVGARTNRVELVQSRLDDRDLNLTTLQSKVEDADIAALMIKATTAQTIYESALKSSAQILQPSLMDFMS